MECINGPFYLLYFALYHSSGVAYTVNANKKGVKDEGAGKWMSGYFLYEYL